VFQLFKNTYLDIQGVSPPSGYRVYFSDVLSIYDVARLTLEEPTIYYVPKFVFSKLVIEYLRELFQFATPEILSKIHRTVIDRMQFQLAYLLDNQTRNTYIDCYLPKESVYVLTEVAKYKGIFEGQFKRHIGIEWLMCDYFNQGIYTDEYQKKFREIIVENVVLSVKEIRQEMLYKVGNISKLFPYKYDSIEDLFSKELTIQFLFDPSLENPNHLMTRYKIDEIADVFYSFSKLYNRGYDKTKFQEMTLLSLFLDKAHACLSSGNCDNLMQEEIKRDFSIIFSQHRFIRKINCLTIDWIYQMKRENNPDLGLLSL
jgi:hypothetical protein